MNLRTLPPVYDKPVPVRQVAPGIWVTITEPDTRTIEQLEADYFRTTGLFSKPMSKRKKSSSGQ